jgi:hypothetical protein
MIKFRNLLLTLSLFAIIISSCSKSDDPTIAIEGVVKDAQGNRVSNAKIALTYHLPGYNPDTTSNKNIVIQFKVANEQKVSLRIKDRSGDLETTLVDEIKPQGSYSYSWNLKNDDNKLISSGIYTKEIIFENSENFEKKLFLNIGHYNSYSFEEVSFLAKTDRNGRFIINKNDLVFSNPSFDELSLEGTLSNRLTVWAIDSERGVASNSNVFYDVQSSQIQQAHITY